MGARETALNVLLACRKDGGWSNGVLKDYLLRDRLDSREAALASVDGYGLVQDVCGLPFFDRAGVAAEGQAFFILMETAREMWQKKRCKNIP